MPIFRHVSVTDDIVTIVDDIVTIATSHGHERDSRPAN